MSDSGGLLLDSASSQTMSTQTDEPLVSHSADGEDFVTKLPDIVLPERPKEATAESHEEHPQITTASEDADEVEPNDGAEDVDQSNEIAHAQQAPIAKKRKQDLAFQDWLLKNQRESTTASKADLDRHLDKISISGLVKHSSREKIITSPREYQIELYERARDENTIVVLDTGMSPLPL